VRKVDEVHEAPSSPTADADQKQQAAVGDCPSNSTPMKLTIIETLVRNLGAGTPCGDEARNSAIEEHGLACALQDDVQRSVPARPGIALAISVSRRAAARSREPRRRHSPGRRENRFASKDA
jgi:hypothetical protein